MALMEYREPNQVLWRGSRPAHNGTQVLESVTVTNGNITFPSFPLAKTFYLCWATMGYFAVAAGVAHVRIQTGASATVVDLFYDCLQAAAVGETKSQNYWPPIEVPAGYLINLRSSVALLTVIASIHGWYE